MFPVVVGQHLPVSPFAAHNLFASHASVLVDEVSDPGTSLVEEDGIAFLDVSLVGTNPFRVEIQ
jgi:hypothetical protein